MTDKATGTTNTTPNTCVIWKLSDKEMWSLAQQFTYLQLTSKQDHFALNAPIPGTNISIRTPIGVAAGVATGTPLLLRARIPIPLKKQHFLRDYNVRARRISATYASIYLETAQGGNPSKKGRYYWMALAAFAAKTVACSLELFRVNLMPIGVNQVEDRLGKGNLWLFYEITPWHWMHSNHPDCMQAYEKTRSDTNLVPELLKLTKDMPWSDDALPKIDHFKTNDFITKAFELVREIEKLPKNHPKVPDLQLKHLTEIAQHEQVMVLQRLIYNDQAFINWLEMQRNYFIQLISPTLEIVFAAACKTENPELKSIAPDGIELENEKQRMAWIGDVAKNFHNLMQKNKDYMEAQIQTIASWSTLEDSVPHTLETENNDLNRDLKPALDFRPEKTGRPTPKK